MTVLVFALNAHAESAKLTTPTLQSCRAQLKFPSKIDLFLRLPGGALTTFPYKLRQNFFSWPGVHLHPLHSLTTPIAPEVAAKCHCVYDFVVIGKLHLLIICCYRADLNARLASASVRQYLHIQVYL